MIPSPSDITYFVEVANRLNLSRAAESLGISQPSLTLAMQRIEAAMGVSVMTRHKRGVSLTKAGKQFLIHTRHLIQQWEMIKTESLNSINQVQGSITIGCHPSVAIYALPQVLEELLTAYSKLEIKLKHDISRKITEKVITLSIDIGIVINPVRHPDLVINKLGDDKTMCWTGATSRPVQNIKSGQAILICDPELSQTQTILKNLKKVKLNVGRLLTTNNMEVIAKLTQNGCGIGILPERVAVEKHLIPVPKTPYFKDEICIIYRGENRNVKAIQIIIQAIKNSFILNL